MAKSQENGSPILLGLKDYEVKQVREDTDRSFRQVRRELGVDYGTLRRPMEREINEKSLKKAAEPLFPSL